MNSEQTPINYSTDTGLRLRMSVAGMSVMVYYVIVVIALDFFAAGISTLNQTPLPRAVAGSIFSITFPLLVMGYLYRRSQGSLTKNDDIDELRPENFPDLYRKMENISKELKIDCPVLYEWQTNVPNAYAVGRRTDGHIVVSSALLHELPEDEITAVLAHEAAHLRNRDSLLMVMTETVRLLFVRLVYIVGAFYAFSITMFFQRGRPYFSSFREGLRRFDRGITGILLSFITTSAAILVLLSNRWLSRSREYAADSVAAQVVGDPVPMKNALKTIEQGHERLDPDSTDAGSVPNSLRIRGKIENASFGLLRTHPSTENRIRRLERMEASNDN